VTLRLATGPVSWGVDFAGAPGNPPWPEVLDGIRAAGYAGTELGPLGYLPGRRDDFAGLELAGGFVFEPLHDPAARDRVVRHARRVAERVADLGGGYVLLIDAVTPERAAAAGRDDAPRLAAPRAAAMLETIDRAAAAIAARGLRPLVHPHAGTYVERIDEIAAVLELCDLCVDTAHFAYAGLDPVPLLGRAGCVHLKDLDPARIAGGFWASVAAGAFVPVGSGAVDFAAVLRTLAALGYDGWAVVEQDRVPGAGDPVADLVASREHLERLAVAA
jgi:inosose dehydratase